MEIILLLIAVFVSLLLVKLLVWMLRLVCLVGVALGLCFVVAWFVRAIDPVPARACLYPKLGEKEDLLGPDFVMQGEYLNVDDMLSDSLGGSTAPLTEGETNGKRLEKNAADEDLPELLQQGKLPRWTDQPPFVGDEDLTVYWPVTVGPFLAEDLPSAKVLARIIRFLSTNWVDWLVRDLPKKLSPDLSQALERLYNEGFLSQEPQRFPCWIPEELPQEVLSAINRAVDAYVAEYIAPDAVGKLRIPADVAAKKMVRDVWFERWEVHPKSQATEQISYATSDVGFRMHLLLQFTPEIQQNLRQQWSEIQRKQRAWRVVCGFGLVMLLLSIVYLILKFDLSAKKKRHLLVSCLLVVMTVGGLVAAIVRAFLTA